MTRSTASVFTLSPDGHASLVAKVPDLAMVKIETHYRGRKESVLMPPGLGLHALAAMLETFVVVTAANAYVPDVVDQHARLVSRNVVDNPRRVVNKSMRDADLIWQLRRLHGPQEGGMIDSKESDRLVRTSPFADSLPSIARMFVAPGNTLWVLDGQARFEKAWAATAFRSDGAIIGRLVAAGSGRPVAFGNDRVVIKSEDADGVVSLTARRIALAPRSKR